MDNALQIGFGSKKAKILVSWKRTFCKSKVEPKEKIAEFKVSEDANWYGKIIGVNHFIPQKVIIGSSKGKGFTELWKDIILQA